MPTAGYWIYTLAKRLLEWIRWWRADQETG